MRSFPARNSLRLKRTLQIDTNEEVWAAVLIGQKNRKEITMDAKVVIQASGTLLIYFQRNLDSQKRDRKISFN